MKLCLTNKTLTDERITLIENDNVVSDETELANIFNEHFSNIVSNLNVTRLPNITLTRFRVKRKKNIWNSLKYTRRYDQKLSFNRVP